MQVNINEYKKDIFEPQFKATSTYAHMCSKYTNINFDWIWRPNPRSRAFYPALDDRFQTQNHIRTISADRGLFDAVPFYYLQWLTSQCPTAIYDIGCGANLFKQFIPQVIGLSGEPEDSENFLGDVAGYVDDDYIASHQNYFESAFAFSSLHFVPLSSIRQRILDIVSMLKSGGRIVLAFHTNRMIERTNPVFVESLPSVENYVRTQLDNMPFEFLVFDLDVSPEACLSTGMGTLRMVIQKP